MQLEITATWTRHNSSAQQLRPVVTMLDSVGLDDILPLTLWKQSLLALPPTTPTIPSQGPMSASFQPSYAVGAQDLTFGHSLFSPYTLS